MRAGRVDVRFMALREPGGHSSAKKAHLRRSRKGTTVEILARVVEFLKSANDRLQ